MADLPVMLKVRGWRCVVVGGGAVALRRARMLIDAGASVVVIAPAVDEALAQLPVTVVRRRLEAGDLQGARLVVIASDDPAANDAAATEAAAHGILINHAGDPRTSDLSIPAHARHGAVTLAVDTGGIAPTAAARIRRDLSAALDPDWPRLLDLAAPYRRRIQQRFADAPARRDRLRRLTDHTAMTILKTQGDEALRHHLDALCDPDPRH